MIFWPLVRPYVHNTSEWMLCISMEIKYLFFIKFLSTCKVALCDLGLGAP